MRKDVYPINVFIAYSRADKELLKQFQNHFSILERANKFKVWTNEMIKAGGDWGQEILNQMNQSKIILLLISSDFLASEYHYENELSYSLQLHEQGKARVIPIILRMCMWGYSPFAKLKALPSDGVPVVSKKWDNPDEPFVNIIEEILKFSKIYEKDLGIINRQRVEYDKQIKVKNFFDELIQTSEKQITEGKWVEAIVSLENALELHQIEFAPSKSEIRSSIIECRLEITYEEHLNNGKSELEKENYEMALIHFANALNTKPTNEILSLVDLCRNELNLESKINGQDSLNKKELVEITNNETYSVFKPLVTNLNSYNERELKAELERLKNMRISRVIFSLEEIKFLDSSGLSMILSSMRNWPQNGKLILIGIKHQNVKKLFELSKLNLILPIYENMNSALEALGNPNE